MDWLGNQRILTKAPESNQEKQQQIQPTYDAGSVNWTKLSHIVWFQEISIPPPRMVFLFELSHPLDLLVNFILSLKFFGYWDHPPLWISFDHSCRGYGYFREPHMDGKWVLFSPLFLPCSPFSQCVKWISSVVFLQIPSIIQWHPGDAVVLVCSADGDIQVNLIVI